MNMIYEKKSISIEVLFYLYLKRGVKVTVEIGILIAVCGLALSFATFWAGRAKAYKTDGKESGMLKSELGYIRKGVDDIRIDLRANEKNIGLLSERVTRVEESTKQAHKRIDNFKEGGVKNG